MGREVLFDFGVEAGVDDEEAVLAGFNFDGGDLLDGRLPGEDVAALGEDLLAVVLPQLVRLGVPLLFEVSFSRRLRVSKHSRINIPAYRTHLYN